MHEKMKLPKIGNMTWLTGCQEQYIVISLERSKEEELYFWKKNNYGFTPYPWEARYFSGKEVLIECSHYNNGTKYVAVPLTVEAMNLLQMKVSVTTENLRMLFNIAEDVEEDEP